MARPAFKSHRGPVLKKGCAVFGDHTRAFPPAWLAMAFFAVSAPAQVPYEATIRGLTDRELGDRLRAVSTTFGLQAQAPASEAQLRRRVESDIPRLREELRARGYYNAGIEADIHTDKTPAGVVFQVSRGEVYRVADIELVLLTSPGEAPPELETRLDAGERGAAEKVLAEEARLIKELTARGYAFARVEDRRVVVNHDGESISVRWTLQIGPAVRFGPVTVEGLAKVKESSILRMIPWKRGRTYDQRHVGKLESILRRSGLFSTVRIVLEGEVETGDEVPMTIRVAERKHRTVRVGILYRSDTGVGGTVSWEHRNLLRGGEHFEASVTWSELSLGGEIRFEKPSFLRHDQRLISESRVFREDTDAYEDEGAETVLALERTIRSDFTAFGGVGYKYSDVEQLERAEIFGLVFFPFRLDWNPSDSLLDPTSGWRLILEGTPYRNTRDREINWVQWLGEYRHYISLDRASRYVLAGRLTLGSIVGENTRNIPADERFYAGGGGSIRGYEFQSVGPLASDNSPVGGNGLLETSLEFRVRLGERWGVTGFADGGTAYLDDLSDADETIRWGAGAGLRYHTGIGPVRIDVAIPLNRRNEIDDSVQFYISLGQAF